MRLIFNVLLVFSLIASSSIPALANETFDAEIDQNGFDEYGIKNHDLIHNELENTNEMNRNVLSTTWDTLPSNSNVSLNKEWTITFSGGTVTLDKIAGIVIEKNGAFIPVKVRLFPTANQAIVSPLETYVSNETYTVRVFLENGKRYKMTFTTKSVLTENEQLGNTHGNITNYGYVAEHKDWIFYRNFNDNGYLYKMKADGSEKTLLSNHSNVNSINIMDGWVYYISRVDGYSGMYKVRMDGSDRQGIRAWNTSSNNYYYNRLVVTNTSLFTENYTGSSYSDSKVHIYSLDGVTNNEIRNGRRNIIIHNNILISITNDKNSQLEIYDMTTKKVLYTSSERVGEVNLSNDWLYYLSLEDYRIYKIKLDGSLKQKVNDDRTTYLNVYEDWIYYINDENQSVNRIKIDGTSKQLLTDSKGSRIWVTSDWLFYRDPTNNKMYQMKHDGSQWQEVK